MLELYVLFAQFQEALAELAENEESPDLSTFVQLTQLKAAVFEKLDK